jgi:YD repeat-containing protein
MDYTFDTQRGNLTNRTNHAFANYTENFTYDSQDRLTAIGGATIHTQSYDDGGQATSYYNAFGWLVQSKALSLNDTYVYKSYEYDAVGRKISESEPYFTSPTCFDPYKTRVLF